MKGMLKSYKRTRGRNWRRPRNNLHLSDADGRWIKHHLTIGPYVESVNPSTIAGAFLDFWYRSDLDVTTSGSDVTDWADQSGNAYDLSAAGGAEPTLVTGQMTEGYPGVDYTGSGEDMQFPASSTQPDTGTVWIVSKFSYTPNKDMWSLQRLAATGNNRPQFFYARSTADQRGGVWTSSSDIFQWPTGTTGYWSCNRHKWEVSTKTMKTRIYDDTNTPGTEISNVAGATLAANGDWWQLGRGDTYAAGASTDATYIEVIGITTQDATIISDMETYLANRYSDINWT